MNNDSWIVENIIPKQKSKPVRNFIESVEVNYSPTRKTRLKLCVLGSWAAQMPPYGLARLSALTKSAGYWTKIYDFNVHTYHFLKYEDPALEDAFNPANDWWWRLRDDYYKKDSQFQGITEVIFGKHRHGPTGTIRLAFVPNSSSFENISEEQYQQYEMLAKNEMS